MPPDTPSDPLRRLHSRWWLLALLALIVLLFLSGPCQKVGDHRRDRDEVTSHSTIVDTVDIIVPSRPAAESPSTLSAALHAPPALPAEVPHVKVPPPDLSPRRVAGSVDSWEDWNASFSDTVIRTYSAIFDSSRLDTAGGGVVFSPSGLTLDNLRVKQVECIVDSVRPLVKYTFPGEKVNFGIGVAFAAGVSWQGTLRPRPGAVRLDAISPSDDRLSGDAGVARNQFMVVLNSPPGYAYTVRTAIECYVADGSPKTRTYYTAPAKVDFRRMVRFESLIPDTGDTLFVVTNNPAAIRDVAGAAPRSPLAAVFVPLSDPSEGDGLLNEHMPNVRIHVSSPRRLDRSFVILSDSGALVERNILDPDFRRTAELKLKGVQLQQIGLPRVTAFVTNADSVEELRLLYRHFARLNSQ